MTVELELPESGEARKGVAEDSEQAARVETATLESAAIVEREMEFDLVSAIETPDIYMANTGTSLGRGVYAARAFEEGDVVETSPAVTLEDSYRCLPSSVQRIVFDWSYLAKSEIKHAIALGFGSLYNHSDSPNLTYDADSVMKSIRFVASRKIIPHEHLTINYNQIDEGDERKISWFETHGVEKVELS
jgi:hypothetical protein